MSKPHAESNNNHLMIIRLSDNYSEKLEKKIFPRRELNPGLDGESVKS